MDNNRHFLFKSNINLEEMDNMTLRPFIIMFHINLQCGEFEGADIAFHFNPRFDFWDKVVFNTFREGVWEGEEKIKKMPFKRGEHFEMVIVVNSEGYQVNVNGKEFYFYQHRIPVERVCALEIGGDVCIQTINVIGGFTGGMGGGYPAGMGAGYPSGGMGGGGMGYPGENLPVMGMQPIYNPTVPYSNMIPGGMSGKRTIVVRGMVPYGAQRFAVNFVVGFSRDIAFHLNPRIREGLVIRNSRIGGLWGQEEIEIGINPFMEGQYFDLSIRCGHRRFKIFVNGQHLCDFFHRFEAFTQVDMLEIEGDVQISYIHF
ncbi:galectin-4-like [Triplophysa rosa]|uniref:galectin-4-like n=1 Tax=Triplophysa rosa TaxID=992332 RepID=UPI002545FBBA|nr:galectin-4-like [Triplophysa rosa]